jgi:hypothetical protein
MTTRSTRARKRLGSAEGVSYTRIQAVRDGTD